MNSLTADTQACRRALEGLALPAFAGPPKRGPFIVALEGPNGAGKTTLCRLLCRTLNAPGCLGTDEAWFTEPFKVRMIRDAEWHASAMFFLSGCFEQMRTLGNRPERLVIMDRSLWSTLAAHAAHSVQRLQALLAMLGPIAADIHIPHLTLVLQAPFDTCLSRSGQKTGSARSLDELTATAAFHAREQEFYHWLGRQGASLAFLNVEQDTPEQVLQQALAMVRKEIPC
jgi:thymidylate kinase